MSKELGKNIVKWPLRENTLVYKITKNSSNAITKTGKVRIALEGMKVKKFFK